jgi:hypothetical protein
MGKRVEEGVAVLVKTDLKLPSTVELATAPPAPPFHSLHVSKIQTLFLPRDFEDVRSAFFPPSSLSHSEQ